MINVHNYKINTFKIFQQKDIMPEFTQIGDRKLTYMYMYSSLRKIRFLLI